ncbi:Putative methionine and alanine importer, small subunit [Gordonia malaquae]|uniref:Methionine/alanine importer small subunit n=1 Tax=Gordonia malaquae NBRC 108250 TaxID=1223542 RepID=M3UFU8_GORML|nr:methionine/alanine import family NSS transporter small subunit [Gordonia malaquae]GAC78085.1 hypothetical protein GM1_002_00630 [Gordonia malaquae NBRC 108250]SED92233.1 Putative methionine and alanine importer, small subunit [Gordonia malaquae]
MTGTAIVLFLIAIGIVWGGLITSIVFLIRNPEVADLPDVDEVADAARAAQPHPSRDT